MIIHWNSIKIDYSAYWSFIFDELFQENNFWTYSLPKSKKNRIDVKKVEIGYKKTGTKKKQKGT